LSTLAQFRSQVSYKLGLDNTAASVEQGLIDGWVNEAVVDILMETQVYIVESVASLTASQGDYVMDSNILIVKDVNVNSGGISYMFDHVSPDEIIQRRALGAGSNVVGPSRLYALNGADVLMLYPNPSAGDSLTFYYVPRPTALVNASDDPSSAALGGIPSEWHKAIQWYALWQAADYMDDDSSQQGERYRTYYESWLKRIKKERSYKGGRRLGAIVAGRRRRPLIPHDNSADYGY
jgi:hypothetical protein